MSSLPFLLIMALVMLALIILLFLPLILRVATAVHRASRIANSPELSSDATVLSKRIEMAAVGRDTTEQRHFATFEFPSGERMELELTGHEFGLLAEADQGTLTWKGPRYRGFTREIMR